MAIYVFGSLAYDRIITYNGNFSDHFNPAEDKALNVWFLVDQLDEKRGGTAGNIAYTLHLLGEPSNILATVGKDFAHYEAELKRIGLPIEGIRKVENQLTAGAYLTTDANNSLINCFNPGAMKHSCEFDASCTTRQDIAIIAPGNADDMVGLPEQFRNQGTPYIFDPGQQITALSGDGLLSAIRGSRMLITNKVELGVVEERTGRTKAELLEMTDYIVTTMSEDGSVVDRKGELEQVKAASPVEVKDTIGAGDSFRSGLLKGLTNGKSVAESCKLGAVCASYCIEQYGTQEHGFSMDQFNKRYKDTYGEEHGL